MEGRSLGLYPDQVSSWPRESTHAISLAFDAVVSCDFDRVTLSRIIVANICLPSASWRFARPTVLSVMHGFPRLAFVHLAISIQPSAQIYNPPTQAKQADSSIPYRLVPLAGDGIYMTSGRWCAFICNQSNVKVQTYHPCLADIVHLAVQAGDKSMNHQDRRNLLRTSGAE
jgi:hypothetical protein